MAWLPDGTTLQYLPETGAFHDNPALLDDLTHEQFNQYIEVALDVAQDVVDQLEPFDSSTMAWLVERFRSQDKRLLRPASAFGLRPGNMVIESSPDTSHEQIHSLPPIAWIANASDPSLAKPPVVRDTVARLIAAALASEPEITATLIQVTENGELLGMEYRTKSPESLGRKVDMWFCARSPTERILRPAELVVEIPDVVRYTYVASGHKQMLVEAKAISERLVEERHRLVSAEHSYVDGNFYKGFKTVWIASDGQRWELQFRSELNLEYKDRAYPHYKASRDLERSLDERKASLHETTRIYAALPAPEGLQDGATLAGVPVRTRLYPSPFDV